MPRTPVARPAGKAARDRPAKPSRKPPAPRPGAATQRLPRAETDATRRAAELHERVPEPLPADSIAPYADDSDFVTALARGMLVLQAYSERRRRMSIADVSRVTGIARATVRRSLYTLEKMGFVACDDSRRYFLRSKVLSFGHAYVAATPLALIAQPVLDRCSDRLRESCSLAVLDGDDIIYLARSRSSNVMSPVLNVGKRIPAHCTSIGLVLLAHLPAAELDNYLANVRLRMYAPNSITSKEKLRAVLDSVRGNGFAIADRLMESRVSLGVPVQDSAGSVVAGINVIFPGGVMTEREMAARFLVPLQNAAHELGMVLMPEAA